MSLTHRDGCPKGRSETYGATSPGGEALTVTRCIDCGADAVAKGKAASEVKPKGKAESAAPDAGAER